MSEQEKSYSDIKKDFYYRYAKYVIPALSDYESKRKLTLFFALLSSSAIIIAGVAIGGFLLYSDIHGARIEGKTYKLPIFLIVLGFIVYSTIKKDFENKIKTKVMPIVCGCFTKLKWYPYSSNGNLSDIYKEMSLIPNFSRLDYDDCFEGNYNSVPFIIEENEAIRGSGKNQTTVFKGVIITLNMNKNFKGNTVIRPNSMLHTSPSSKLHHTVLEDVEFEKKFDVYTDDDVEARYLITTALMERLNDMQVAFKADKISAGFYQNKFFIALHTKKDLFALGSLIKNVCDKDQFFTMFEEVLSIIKLIDYFKLNQKIGL